MGELATLTSRASVTMVRVGSEVYPLRTSPNCSTCQSPHRMFIENCLVRGDGYSRIARQVADMDHQPGDPVPSARAIARHVAGEHLVNPALVRRQIQEERAKQSGMSLYEADNLVDHLVVNDLVIQRGFERMTSGEIEPNVGDVLKAIQFKQSLEGGQQEGFSQEIWEAIFFAVYDTMARELTPEQFSRIRATIDRNPMIKALTAKAQGPTARQVEEDDDTDDEGVAEASLVDDE